MGDFFHIIGLCTEVPFLILFNFIMQDIAMALLFGIGYAGIIFEESLAFNKSGVGLLMAVSLWVVRSIGVRPILLVVFMSYFLSTFS